MRFNSAVYRTYLARGARLWFATRLLASGVIAFGGMNPLSLTAATRLWLIVGCVLVCFAEIRRRHERALLANLAVNPLALVATFALPAIIGEVTLGLAWHFVA